MQPREAPMTAAAMDLDTADPKAVAASIEQVLGDLPETEVEARRAITRDLGFDPSGEELRALRKLSAQGPKGPAFEMSLGALALRLRAERKLGIVNEGPLDADAIEDAARKLEVLFDELRAFHDALQAAIGALGLDGKFLREVGETLLPSSIALTTARIVAPRLVQFARARAEGELALTVPHLRPADVTRVVASLRGDGDRGDGASRAYLNALALRTVIQDDLAAWDAVREGRSDEAGEAVGRRLQRNRAAYLNLAGVLQRRQDLALVAGLQDLARELRMAKADLFAEYTRLAAVLNEPGVAPDANDDVGGENRKTIGDLERLLEECRAADAIAEAQRAVRQTAEELFLDALNQEKREGSVRVARRSDVDSAPNPKRLRILLGVAGVLFVACIVVYATMLGGRREPTIEVTPTELSGPLAVSNAMALGPMIYLQTNRFVWDELENTERVAHVAKLGEQVRARGFSSLYLADENEVELAVWDTERGVMLTDRRPEPSRD